MRRVETRHDQGCELEQWNFIELSEAVIAFQERFKPMDWGGSQPGSPDRIEKKMSDNEVSSMNSASIPVDNHNVGNLLPAAGGGRKTQGHRRPHIHKRVAIDNKNNEREEELLHHPQYLHNDNGPARLGGPQAAVGLQMAVRATAARVPQSQCSKLVE